MFIRCLGSVALQHDDGGETQLAASLRHILAVLAAAGPGGLSADRLADELYGDELTPGWEASVRKGISRLRPALGVNEIVTHNGRYILNVPQSQVDLWTLLAIDQLDVTSLPEDLVQELLTNEPFGGVEPSPMLLEVREPIALARLQLIQKMATAQTTPWSAKTMLQARTLAVRSHYRADLFSAVLELHLANGHDPSAAEFAARGRQFLVEEMGVMPSAELQALIDSASTPLTNRPDFVAEVGPVPGRVIGVLEPAVTAGVIERPDLLASLEAHVPGRGVLVSGDSGAGKSALARSLVPQLAKSGHHVLWLSGRRGSTSGYQPFLTALPALEEDLAPLLDDGGNELLRTQCWTAVRRRLANEFIDLPLVLFIDDTQWLDSHSQSLAIFLASTQDPTSPTLVAIGRDDPSAPNWHELKNDLLRLGLASVEVGAFTQPELVELIGLYHRTATSKQRHDFAWTLLSRRAALPAVAHELVRSADPDTLTFVSPRTGNDGDGIWVSRVRPTSQQVAATAAILGMRFRYEAIAELGGFDLETIVDAIVTERTVHVRYVGLRLGEESQWRHLQPVAFERMGDQWRFVASDLEAADARARTYVLTRVLDARPDESGESRSDSPAETDSRAHVPIALDERLTDDQRRCLQHELKTTPDGRSVVLPTRSVHEFLVRYGGKRPSVGVIWPPLVGSEER